MMHIFDREIETAVSEAPVIDPDYYDLLLTQMPGRFGEDDGFIGFDLSRDTQPGVQVIENKILVRSIALFSELWTALGCSSHIIEGVSDYLWYQAAAQGRIGGNNGYNPAFATAIIRSNSEANNYSPETHYFLGYSRATFSHPLSETAMHAVVAFPGVERISELDKFYLSERGLGVDQVGQRINEHNKRKKTKLHLPYPVGYEVPSLMTNIRNSILIKKSRK